MEFYFLFSFIYFKVIEDVITMKVIEHFFLFPEKDIYILPTTSVQFNLALVKT